MAFLPQVSFAEVSFAEVSFAEVSFAEASLPKRVLLPHHGWSPDAVNCRG
jgi:hypothetical protein